MTDTHADAVAALVETLKAASVAAWLDLGSPEPGEQRSRYWDQFSEGILDAILADPAKRRALLAVLLDTDTVAAALHDTAKHNHNLGEGMARAICWSDSSHSRRAAAIVAALTREPTDAE